ncbi:DUF418 domain-containing protein [Peribacillus alkalitolerans]|uniref:DUF418 domain-containing protein n=1 Tax=Peribacillus alkalitolerans TaxID=1550385 RepID=UPI001F07E162|nr:DUF418 domain-containing protein [Peribacillus alkalitolerans]
MNSLGDKRIETIDILRGIALLGIFLVNMPSFFSPVLHIDPYTYYKEGIDRNLSYAVDVIAQASFYPLFAFLFGYGAVLLERSLEKKGIKFRITYTRRMIALLCFGVIHAFLVWHGDILINYAVLGLVYLLFHKLQGKTLLWVGSLLYIIPQIIMSLLVILASFVTSAGEDSFKNQPDLIKQSIEIYQNGTFMQITHQRWEDWYATNGGAVVLMFIAILPYLLVGAGAAKIKWLENPERYQKSLKITMWVSLVGALIFKLMPYYAGQKLSLTLVQDFIGGTFLTFFYITSITLLLRKETMQNMLKPLSFAGRMSITNYLTQSVVCSFIFYSYGLGLYERISYTTGVVLVLVIYTLQVVFSKWWLRSHTMGPVEYLWRTFTYGKRPRWKKSKEGEVL